MRILSIFNVTQSANALCARLNLQFGPENTQSVSSNSASKIFSQTVSSFDLSDADWGTLLLKGKLYGQAYGCALVNSQEHQLSSLNTYINNFQFLAEELAVVDLFETLVHYCRKNSIFEFI